MRKLGYPPGWLEEAKHITSSLQMFDIDGKNVKDKAAKRQPGLNRDKIIEYPGFNVPLEDGFKDVIYVLTLTNLWIKINICFVGI